MNEQEAYAFVEARLWPIGPVCPHCKVIGGHYALKGKTTRPGLWKCRDCRGQFRITLGTIFESSHIPLSKWLEAITLFAGSKSSVTCSRLEQLGISYKSAWRMQRQIREFSRYQPENFQRLTG